MKRNKEAKKWIRVLVKHYAKKNGVVKSCYFDCPEMEVKQETNKRVKALKDKSWRNAS